MTGFEASRRFAQSLDAADPLAAFRDQFNFPEDRSGRRNIYVCGNSLGLQPKLAAQYVADVMSDWARLGVEGHFKAKGPGFNTIAWPQMDLRRSPAPGPKKSWR